mmetsp:Transcript_27984/g.41267  ORF Transcript_27984/g.41267 Transcript_27984/m.41267 type:complete len:95 (-) Transcript_27984:71-355(-)
MVSSTPAPSDVTISSLPSGNSADYSIILETVLDESTIEAAEAVVALGSDLKQYRSIPLFEQTTETEPAPEMFILSTSIFCAGVEDATTTLFPSI